MMTYLMTEAPRVNLLDAVMAARVPQTYRGFEINYTPDVLHFTVRASDAYCFVSHYRREDDAPCLSMHASIDACKAEIDMLIEDEA